MYLIIISITVCTSVYIALKILYTELFLEVKNGRIVKITDMSSNDENYLRVLIEVDTYGGLPIQFVDDIRGRTVKDLELNNVVRVVLSSKSKELARVYKKEEAFLVLFFNIILSVIFGIFSYLQK